MDFEALDTAYSTFGGTEFFWLTPEAAAAANLAIDQVLNAVGAPGLNNGWAATPGTEQYSIWLQDSIAYPGDGQLISVSLGGAMWTNAICQVDCGYSSFGFWQGTAWSVATVVPVPAAAWLFGSALLGLGAMKRKKG